MSKGFRLTPDGRLKESEADVKKAVTEYLRYRRFYPLRLQSGLFAPFDELCEACKRTCRKIPVGEPGIPDLAIPRFFVEVKAARGTLSAVQQGKIQFLNDHWGLKTAVPRKLEELIEWLEKHKGEL